MSILTRVDSKKILKAWNLCCDSFAKAGHILRFPNGTDPQKTYQWRYATYIAEKLEEWEFDDATSRIFIDHVANYVKEKKLLRKGMSAFCQHNILDICYSRFEFAVRKTESTIKSLAVAAEFLKKNTVNGSMLEGLMGRRSEDATFNIITWYDTGKLTKLYLALSKSCTIALANITKIDKDQRDQLPKQSELFVLWSDFNSDKANESSAKQVLGSDWR